LSSNRSDLDDHRSAPLPDDFAAAMASAGSSLGCLGSRIVYFPAIGSTNDVAAMLAGHGPSEGAVVIADMQTAGRGRRGHQWFSPPGSGLYVSVVLTPGASRRGGSPRAARLLTLAAGVGLAEGIASVTGLTIDVKWPNDLYIARRKLAGILAEGTGSGSDEAVVLGYGINVRAAAYPSDLRDRVTSLESELGRQVDRALVLVASLASLARRYDDLLAGRFDAILDAWRARAPGSTGARVRWETPAGASSGITAGIDDDGALLVTAGNRVERIVAGELTWL
jgi:BirA family transcriptional regulator, biotin operon repressor / biotin---[acetyl-CoA-carboxylase] ligase